MRLADAVKLEKRNVVDQLDDAFAAVPASRVGTVDEIAPLVMFLVSDGCDYLTGANIVVDGELTLGFCASRPDL